MIRSTLRYGVGLAIASLAMVACTEPKVATTLAPNPGVDIRLALSNAHPVMGDTVVASVKVTGTAAPSVASFTGRVDFDSTRLRFIDERTIDGASTAINATGTTVRMASVAASGYAGGELVSIRFVAIGPSAGLALRFTLDELHSMSMKDLKATATVTASPGGTP